METNFPVGGSRQVVYDYLLRNGFTKSKHSDKTWYLLAASIEIQIFGAGSMARVTKGNSVIGEWPIKEAVEYCCFGLLPEGHLESLFS